MTRKEFSVIVKGLKAVYADPRFIADADAFNMWYALLQDLGYGEASAAAQRYMMTNKFPPTVADIREQAAKIKRAGTAEDMNEMAAWGLVQQAVRRSTYYAEEEYVKLPAAVQRAVGSPAQLREWAAMDTGGAAWNVMQSNFMRTYRAEQARRQENAMVSPEIMRLMENREMTMELTEKGEPLIGEQA